MTAEQWEWATGECYVCFCERNGLPHASAGCQCSTAFKERRAKQEAAKPADLFTPQPTEEKTDV